MSDYMTEDGKNQVAFDPFVNKGVAVMLDSERKKICGVMGDSSPDDIECCVDLARCPYNFLKFANTGGSECALKYVARAMRGWKEPEPEGVRDFDKEAENEQI